MRSTKIELQRQRRQRHEREQAQQRRRRGLHAAASVRAAPRVPAPSGAHAAKHQERFGRLLHQHAETVAAPRAVRRGPAEEAPAAGAPYIMSSASVPGFSTARRDRNRGALQAAGGRVDDDVEGPHRSRPAKRSAAVPRRPARRRDGARPVPAPSARVRFATTIRAGRASSSGPSTPAAAPPAPSSSTPAAGQRDAGIALDVAHQADAVGVVAEPAVGRRSAACCRPRPGARARVCRRGQREGLELERHRDVAAAGAAVGVSAARVAANPSCGHSSRP